MDEFQAEVLAVTNFHNFLLEVLVAQHFAGRPDGRALLAGLGETIVSRSQNRSTTRPGDTPAEEDLVDVNARMVIAARRFFVRAESRRAEMAAGSGTGAETRY